jgi:hypothetical protein
LTTSATASFLSGSGEPSPVQKKRRILPVSHKFPLNANVRFTQERLSILTPRDRKGLEGRIGVVQGYWNFTKNPTVYFPQDGGRVEIRLLQVDPRHLELVADDVSNAKIDPALSDESDANRKLSQDEMDNLFD